MCFKIPRDDYVATSMYYKEADSHSYLNFKSSHPFKYKASKPASQVLRLRKICSEDDDLEEAATTIESFFVTRGYPVQLVQEGKLEAASILRDHPENTPIYKITSRNYNILANDDSTRVVFNNDIYFY